MNTPMFRSQWNEKELTEETKKELLMQVKVKQEGVLSGSQVILDVADKSSKIPTENGLCLLC